MPSTLREFEGDTAFERYVLDRATPLLPRSQGKSVIELGLLVVFSEDPTPARGHRQ